MGLSIFPLVFVLGLEFGSFANVCIYRWPRNGSIFSPKRSICPWCKRKIRWYDNIPVISFLILRGRCRSCHSPISIIYPLVELSLALIWVGLTFYFYRVQDSVHVLFYFALLFFMFISVVTTLTDLNWKIIPDQATISLFLVGLLSSPWNPILGDRHGSDMILRSVLGALCGAGSLLIISETGKRLMKKEVMGWGDIKLLSAWGTILGPMGALFTLFLSSLIGGCLSLVGLAAGILKRHQYIPFGPFINVGAGITLITLLNYPSILDSILAQ